MLTRLKSWLFSEWFVIAALTVLFLTISLTPTFYELLQSKNLPPDRVFILEHNWPYDFYTYIAKMEQGARGAWTVKDPFTSEPHRGSLLQIFFLLLGKIGSRLGLTTILTYHLARIFLGSLLLLVIYIFICQFFDSPLERVIAFLLVGFSGGFPRIQIVDGVLKIGRFLEGWNVEDNLQRTTFLPHHLFGQILLVVILLLLAKAQKQKSVWLSILAGVLGLIVGIVFSPCLVVVYVTLALWEALKFMKHRSFKLVPGAYCLFAVLSLPSLFYTYFITKIYPWKVIADYEALWALPLRDFILSLGAAFFVGVIGMLLVMWRKKEKFFLVVSWVFAVFLLILVSYRLSFLSSRRFSQARVSIPLAILSTLVLSEVSKLFGSKRKEALALGAALFLIPSVLSAFASLQWQANFIDVRVRATLPLVPRAPQVMYPVKDWYQAIMWLRENTNPDEVVLSEITAGNLIPAFAGNTVYFGHAETVHFQEKARLVRRFFGREMEDREAFDFLKDGGVHYVFFGPQEKEDLKGGSFSYPFLRSIYENNLVVIYQFDETL